MHLLLVLVNDDVIKAYSVPQALVSPDSMTILRGLVQEKVKEVNKGVRFDSDKLKVRLQHVECEIVGFDDAIQHLATPGAFADDILSYVI